MEEIDEMFRNKVPTREFPKYVCVEYEEAKQRGLMNVYGDEKTKMATVHVEHVEQ